MSTNMSAQAQVSAPQSIESEASMLHAAALFNPSPDVRKQALAQIRAQSPYTPEQWEELDAAVGVNQDQEELTAANLPSSLRIDDWVEYSGEIRPQHEVAPNAVERLLGEGFGISSSLARYVYVSQMRGVELDAEVSMNARAKGQQDMPAFGLDGVPLPIVHADYELDSREYQNAQAFGESFDTSVGQEAARAVFRKEEDILWNGLDMSINTDRGTFSIDGLAVDNAKNIDIAASANWATDPTAIIPDLKDTYDAIEQQAGKEGLDAGPMPEQTGAYLFVPRRKYAAVSRGDYETSATDEPVIERVRRQFGELELVPAPRLDVNTAVLLTNDQRYFQIINAQGLTNTNWEVDGGLGLKNKVMASRIPYLKEQPDGIKGVARITGI